MLKSLKTSKDVKSAIFFNNRQGSYNVVKIKLLKKYTNFEKVEGLIWYIFRKILSEAQILYAEYLKILCFIFSQNVCNTVLLYDDCWNVYILTPSPKACRPLFTSGNISCRNSLLYITFPVIISSATAQTDFSISFIFSRLRLVLSLFLYIET